MTTLPGRLRALRLAAGLTVPALAQRANLTRQAVHAIEAGTRAPSLETARLLCRALGASLDALVAPEIEPQRRRGAEKKPREPRTH